MGDADFCRGRSNLVGSQHKTEWKNLLNRRSFSRSVGGVEESKEATGGTGEAEVRLSMLGCSMAKSCSNAILLWKFDHLVWIEEIEVNKDCEELDANDILSYVCAGI